VLGTSDIWEPEVSEWLLLEQSARNVFPRYGFSELRTPVFEQTSVFVRGIGNETEVVQKEMYTFEDRGGRSLTLRPEGTAGVMRAILNSGFSEGDERRVFYMGPMFRGERPAAGRKRQFHQVGCEAVGRASPLADAEMVAMLWDYLQSVGLDDGRLLINTRGTAEDRVTAATTYREFFESHAGKLCEDCRRRLETNVWRILDCKVESCRPVVDQAPAMTDLLSPESCAFFSRVCQALEGMGVSYEVAPRLVRGLDYYEHTVFEVTHAGLGAQDAVAGGGRYRLYLPGLKNPVEGVGFAAGMERLIMARESRGLGSAARQDADAYVVCLGLEALVPGQVLGKTLRDAGLRVIVETLGDRSMKAQMRAANKSGARFCLILGESELEQATVSCKDMKTSDQYELPQAEAASRLTAELAG
jgi:histidyl-tRNA synthetase